MPKSNINWDSVVNKNSFPVVNLLIIYRLSQMCVLRDETFCSITNNNNKNNNNNESYTKILELFSHKNYVLL